MLNVAAYIHWAGKPKNGGIDADEARSRWEAEYAKPSAVVDLLGPTPKLQRRVAIKVRDLVIYRDGQERARTARCTPRLHGCSASGFAEGLPIGGRP